VRHIEMETPREWSRYQWGYRTVVELLFLTVVLYFIKKIKNFIGIFDKQSISRDFKLKRI